MVCVVTQLQHRSQDFAFIFEGVMGIMEQQISSLNPLLPGARKSIPHIPETSTFVLPCSCPKVTEP